jgi:hypothetical protein
MCVGEQLDLHERRAEEATKQFQYRGTAASIRYSVARLIPSSRAASSTSFADSAEVRWPINARMASSRRSATSHSRSFRAPLSFISYQVRIFRERWETAFSRFVQICCPALMNSYTFSILVQLQPIEKTKNPSHGFVQRDNWMRQAQMRTIEDTWRQIGRLVEAIDPAECRNYLCNAGYASAKP